jgi:hypothetical protein
MYKKHLIPLLMLVFAAGCMPNMPGSPTRKKLPPDETKLPFHLSDPANDSALVSLLNTYRPIAIPMLTQWAKEQQGGIVVDLRASESEVPQSASYLIQRENAFTIPVELIWDSRSASRAAYFLQLANDYKEVNITRTGGGISNCFNAGLNF